MSTQMSLLAAPAGESIEVPVCRAVLHLGSRACAGPEQPLLRHRHVPSPPRQMPEEKAWLAALDFAEDARRYNQAPRARLELSARDGAGSNGPMGRSVPGGGPAMWASGRGVEIESQRATWPQLLAGRSEQREVEPDLARARDLAEAYHYLDYYGRAYPEPKAGDKWSPVPLIERLAAEARELGGDPSRLEPRSAYMREAVGVSQSSTGEPSGEGGRNAAAMP